MQVHTFAGPMPFSPQAFGPRSSPAPRCNYRLRSDPVYRGTWNVYACNPRYTDVSGVCILLLLIIVFRSVGSVGLKETIENIRQKSATSSQKKQEKEIFEKVVLYFHQARKFDEWWQAVCLAADKLNFLSSLLPLTNRDGTKRTLCWEKINNNVGADEIVKMTVPIHDRRASSALNLEVRVRANGSLESATRRLSLFSRLLEEYSIANLNTKGH